MTNSALAHGSSASSADVLVTRLDRLPWTALHTRITLVPGRGDAAVVFVGTGRARAAAGDAREVTTTRGGFSMIRLRRRRTISIGAREACKSAIGPAASRM
jgi:hypothetical protein